MEKMLKNKRKILAILLICLATATEGILGSRFFHGEMSRQIDETLKAQAIQMIQGYELYDQNKEIHLASNQADALEINQIHGAFIYNALVQTHGEMISGKLEEHLVESRVREILKNSEEAFQLESVFIQNASAYRNDLDKRLRDMVLKPGYSLDYLAKSPSELYHSGVLDILMKGGGHQPCYAYAKAIYYAPLDIIVIFQGTSGYEKDKMVRVVRHIKNINERTVTMAGAVEDVIIFQENGYSFYSGRFEKGSQRRITRLVYYDLKRIGEFPANIFSVNEAYKTLMVKTPEGQMQERYGYILYDGKHQNYVLVSRLTSDIREQEAPLIFLGRFVAFVNILVVSFIACLLITRKEALNEEGLNL